MDCPNIINLAIALHMDTKQPTIMSQLRADCCSGSVSSSPYLGCVGNRVDVVQWNQLNLDGTVNGTAIPNKVTKLYIWQNSITGTLPLSMPTTVTDLDVDSNQLSGTLTVSALPPALTYLAVYLNQFSGPLTGAFPTAMTYLDVSGTFFTGDVPLLPSTLTTLYLGFTGYPAGNRFTGKVVLNSSPIVFYINDNWITDVVISNPSQLTTQNCDLSDNPLFGNVHIAGLACVKNGLYSANLLPITVTTVNAVTTTSKTASLLRNSRISQYIKTLATGESSFTFHYMNLDSSTSPTSWKYQPKNSESILTKTAPQVITSVFSSDQLIMMGFKLIVDSLTLATVFLKTPYKREYKTLLRKREMRTMVKSSVTEDSVNND